LNGITPLHTAARHGYPECVRILLDHGAYVNAKTRFDVTPLHFVVGQAENPERIEIIKMLIDFKADLNAVTKTGSTALGIAVYRQNSRIAGLLKGYDARFGPNRRDQSQIYSGVYNDYVNDDYLDDHDK
jgi:ankyrin